MAPDHYENFPVASRLLPAALRPAVVALYRYAREADDLADEGTAPPAERLQALDAYAEALEVLERHRHDPDERAAAIAWPAAAATFEPLRRAVRDHQLPLEPLERLLMAFRQDVRHQPPADFQALLHYCEHSANPVGELMLHLYRACTPRHLNWSNHICTGLQLVNFCQDIAIDLARGRIYLPLDELEACQLQATTLAEAARNNTPTWHQFMAKQTNRARQYLLLGAPLTQQIPGRAGWELRLVVLGGLRILERIEAVNYNVFDHRPTLKWPDWLVMLSRIWRIPTQLANTPKMRS